MTSTPASRARLEGRVDPDRGFLPSPDPLTRLPAEFATWDEVGQDLPKLLAVGRAREVASRMPVLDPVGLPDEAVPRAMLLLSFFGHAYVFQTWQHDVAASLPASIARPWVEVAARLGRPPILSYASYALDNWRRLDPDGPIALGNLALLQNFLGGLDEEWFVTVHVQIEAEAAPALQAASSALSAVAAESVDGVVDALARIAAALENMNRTLKRMPEGCDPYVYYHRVRPFIHGWQQHAVTYEGVTEDAGTPRTYYGETGAQSTIVPCLDAALDIRHQQDELRTYLSAMRTYMPRGHVAFLSALEAGPSVRSFVLGCSDSRLVTAYDACVAGVEEFRSTHLDYASRYIQKQAQVGVNSTQYGTGGTPFMRYLKKHRDETRNERPARGST